MLRFPFSLQTQQQGYSITVDKEAVVELYAAESGDDKEDSYLGYGRLPLHDIFLWVGLNPCNRYYPCSCACACVVIFLLNQTST